MKRKAKHEKIIANVYRGLNENTRGYKKVSATVRSDIRALIMYIEELEERITEIQKPTDELAWAIREYLEERNLTITNWDDIDGG